jgi:chromosome partitioning protein
MTKIVSVFNQKGGAGKTQTSMQLGATFALRGYSVLIVDMDRQGTDVRWFGHSPNSSEFPIKVVSYAAFGDDLVKHLRDIAPHFDLVFIDCPPAIESTVPWASLLVSHLGLIPIMPAMDNHWASHDAKQLGLKAQKKNKHLNLACFVNNFEKKRGVDVTVANVIKNDPTIPVLKTVLSRRAAYPESQTFGALIASSPKMYKAAFEELSLLADEVSAIIQLDAPTERNAA